MKILFIKNSYSQVLTPSLSNGMGIIATIVHNAGHKVKAIDHNSVSRFYNDEKVMEVIGDFRPDVLAYAITIYNAYATYQQIKKIKLLFPKLIIIAGGIHMKYCFEEALKYGVDIVINREGELIILPLLKHLEKKGMKNLEKVKGVSYRKLDGTFHFAKEFPILENLDDVPIVNYKLFNLQDFIKGEIPEPDVFVLTGQRGCPFSCRFCSDEYQRADKRVASAKWMFKNIKDLYENYNVKSLFIGDNNITIFPEHLAELCSLMIKSGLNKKISLTCQTTIRFPIKEELIKLMKKAGFNKIIFGIERLTPYSLKMINKEQSIENAHKIFKLLKKHKIEISIFMMVGFPFETPELLKEEKRFFLKFTEYTNDLHLSLLTPIPGTIYYDNYPEIKEWHLDKDDYLISRSYFSVVLDISMFRTIERNFYNLSEETKKAMVDYYFTFKKINLDGRSHIKSVLVKIDFLIAKISQGVFWISPEIENALFNKLRILKHNLKNRLAPK